MEWTEGRGLGWLEGDGRQPKEARPGSSQAEVGLEETDRRAEIAALVPVFSGVLFRVAHAVLRSRTEAEDVVQETFLRVLLHREELSQVREMRVWLIRIAWRLALDRRRRVRPEQMDRSFAEAMAGREMPADAAIASAERYEAVLREVERLPRAERAVLLLAAAEEMSMAEIGAVLGRSESAVRALLFRARARLKERLDAKPKRGGGR